MPAEIMSRLFLQRSPPSLLATAACSGLRTAPDCPPRRALLHLSYSYAVPFGPGILVTQDPKPTCPGPTRGSGDERFASNCSITRLLRGWHRRRHANPLLVA